MAVKRALLPLLWAIGALIACGDTSMDRTDRMPPGEGELVFNAQCTMCHGRTGDLGMGGAKDLVKSTLAREEVIAVITQGRTTMMPYGGILSAREIEAVTDHVLSLRIAQTTE